MNGSQMIDNERTRQIWQEGFTAQHDDAYGSCEMLDAALFYAGMACIQLLDPALLCRPATWRELAPQSPEWWKPSPDPIRNLVKAGALIAAEIDRLQRRAAKQG